MSPAQAAKLRSGHVIRYRFRNGARLGLVVCVRKTATAAKVEPLTGGRGSCWIGADRIIERLPTVGGGA
jgi:hypothetical protein